MVENRTLIVRYIVVQLDMFVARELNEIIIKKYLSRVRVLVLGWVGVAVECVVEFLVGSMRECVFIGCGVIINVRFANNNDGSLWQHRDT